MRFHNSHFMRAALVGGLLALSPSLTQASSASFVGGFNQVDLVASTVPANGDLNPYGVAVVPITTGKLAAGNVLVGNFNDSANLQGTGKTIVQLTPSKTMSVFAQIPAEVACPGGVGLTTALVVLRTDG